MWIDKEGKEYNNIEAFGGAFGFIYRIEHIETGKFYIGKKVLSFSRNKKIGKKELKTREIKPGRIPTKKLVVSESDWKEYFGSCKPLLEEVKKIGKDKYKRTILQLAYNSKQLSYFEIMYQMAENVLQRDDCWNNSIAGKYHKKDFKNE